MAAAATPGPAGAPPPGRVAAFIDGHPRTVEAILLAIYLSFAYQAYRGWKFGVVTERYDGSSSLPVSYFVALAYDAVAVHGEWVRHVFVVVAAIVNAAALFLWWRRSPYVFLGVGTVTSLVAWLFLVPQVGAMGSDLVMLWSGIFAVARWRSPRAGIWTGAVLTVLADGVQIFHLRHALDHVGEFGIPREAILSVSVAWVVFVTVTSAVVIFASAGFAYRYRQEAFWVDRAQYLAQERDQRARLAVAQERARIAREMHDVVSHSLTVMVSLTAGAARAVDDRPERAKAVLRQAAETGRQAVADMRRMLGVLREEDPAASGASGAAALAPQPGEADLWRLAETFQAAGLPVRLTITGRPPDDPVLALTIYRVIQEGLTNALRYADGPGRVDVTVGRSGDRLEVTVDDDGAGGRRPSLGAGQGLVGLRERVALFDGTLEAGPRPDGGWRLRATLTVGDGRGIPA
jgi:signal transduction histidine kinase